METITVKALRELLSKYDENAEVTIYLSYNDYGARGQVEVWDYEKNEGEYILEKEE